MRLKAVLPILAAIGLVLVSCVLSGCSSASSSRPPAGASTQNGTAGTPGTSGKGGQKNGDPAGSQAARAAAFRKWGIPVLPLPPAPPAVKPVRTGGPVVPVVSRVPTDQKIVFVTFDDGAEKDPAFVRMMQDLRVPFTMFLTDDIIKSDYGYFRPLQQLGNHIEDHTLSHPDLALKSPAAQKREICVQQQKLAKEYGARPGLFRPPYGAYNSATRAAVKSCGGLRAIILWRESMQIKRVAFQDPHKRFHPGDIILAHFRGPSQLKGESMTAMTANMLREIAAQGYAVANLEDYV